VLRTRFRSITCPRSHPLRDDFVAKAKVLRGGDFLAVLPLVNSRPRDIERDSQGLHIAKQGDSGFFGQGGREHGAL